MAQLLDEAAIDDALVSLPGWRREDNALVKEVPVTDDAVDNLEAAVAAVADELDHHPQTDRGAGTLSFRLWTHTAGGVTEKDVVLAARIDQALSGTVQDPPS